MSSSKPRLVLIAALDAKRSATTCVLILFPFSLLVQTSETSETSDT